MIRPGEVDHARDGQRVQRERSSKEALARQDKRDYWSQFTEAGHSDGGQETMEEIGQCRHLRSSMT